MPVWTDARSPEAGEARVFHTVLLECNYKDKSDEWQKTTQLRESDLGDAIALLKNAGQFLLKVDG